MKKLGDLVILKEGKKRDFKDEKVIEVSNTPKKSIVNEFGKRVSLELYKIEQELERKLRKKEGAINKRLIDGLDKSKRYLIGKERELEILYKKRFDEKVKNELEKKVRFELNPLVLKGLEIEKRKLENKFNSGLKLKESYIRNKIKIEFERKLEQIEDSYTKKKENDKKILEEAIIKGIRNEKDSYEKKKTEFDKRLMKEIEKENNLRKRVEKEVEHMKNKIEKALLKKEKILKKENATLFKEKERQLIEEFNKKKTKLDAEIRKKKIGLSGLKKELQKERERLIPRLEEEYNKKKERLDNILLKKNDTMHRLNGRLNKKARKTNQKEALKPKSDIKRKREMIMKSGTVIEDDRLLKRIKSKLARLS